MFYKSLKNLRFLDSSADNSNINNFKLIFYTGGVLELQKTKLKGVTHNDIFRMKSSDTLQPLHSISSEDLASERRVLRMGEIQAINHFSMKKLLVA